MFSVGAAWFTPEGSWPGRVRGPAVAVTVEGNYAYVSAEEGGLQLFDVSDRGGPVLVGGYPISGWVRSIQVQGTTAVVGISTFKNGGCAYQPLGRIDVLDLRNPAEPKCVGSYNTLAELIKVQWVGHLLYAEEVSGMVETIDLSDPTCPRGLACWRPPETFSGVCVLGRYAYAFYETHLKVLDVSVPTGFIEVGAVHTPGTLTSMQVGGSRAYGICNSADLSIFDITDPARPSLCGVVQLTNQIYSVAVLEDRACMAMREQGLAIVEMSQSGTPVYVTNICTEGIALGVALSGANAYVAAYDWGLQVIDLAKPGGPGLAAAKSTGLAATGLAVKGTKGYLMSSAWHYAASSGTATIEALDLTDPTNPKVEGVYQQTNELRGFQVVGDRGYYLQGNQVQILDLRGPGEPVDCGYYQSADYAQSLCVAGNYAYVAKTGVNIDIVDVSDVAVPRRVGTWSLRYAGWGEVVVQNGFLYAPASFADQQYLASIDVSNPENPVEVGRTSFPGPGLLRVCGKLLWAASGFSLQAYDISNPAAPVQLGSYYSGHEILDMEPVGEYVYLAGGWEGVEVLYLNAPDSPVRVAEYATQGRAVSVRVLGDHAYVADATSGLLALKLREKGLIITGQPQSQKVFIPGDEPLSVDVYATGPLTFQWYEGESGDTSRPLPGATASSYTPPPSNVTTTYWVRVSSGTTSVDSQAARVTPQPGFVLEEVGSWPAHGRGQTLAMDVVGGYAYLGVQNVGLAIVDMRDSAQPVWAGLWQPTNIAEHPILGVRVANQKTFTLHHDCMDIVDVSNPARATCIGSSGRFSGGRFIDLVSLSPNAEPVVVVATDFGLLVLDVSVPRNPVIVGSWNFGSSVLALKAEGTYVYAALYGSGLKILDLGDPARPALVGAYQYVPEILPASYPEYFDRTVLSVSGPRAYVLSRSNQTSGLEALDISNPAQVKKLGNYPVMAAAMASSGTTVYLCRQNTCMQSNFEVVDWAAPSQPMVLGTCDLPGSSVRAMQTVGGALYVADASAGVCVFDVEMLAEPRFTGGYNPFGNAVDVQIVEDTAYLADGSGGFRVVDVSNPTAPVLAGQLPMPTSVAAVVVEGQRAVLAGWASLSTISLTNPAVPIPLGLWSIEADLRNTGFG